MNFNCVKSYFPKKAVEDRNLKTVNSIQSHSLSPKQNLTIWLFIKLVTTLSFIL